MPAKQLHRYDIWTWNADARERERARSLSLCTPCVRLCVWRSCQGVSVSVCASIQVCACVCVCLQNKTELRKNQKKKRKNKAKACQGSNNTICEWTNSGALTHTRTRRYSTHTTISKCVCVWLWAGKINAFTRFVQNSWVFQKREALQRAKSERRCLAISYMPHAYWYYTYARIFHMQMYVCMYVWVIKMRRRQKKRNQNGVGQVIGDRRSARYIYP